MDDQAGPVEVLAISGAAGVGKTSVAIEVSLQLQRRDVPHALIDTDELDRIHPVPADQAALTEECLRAVWHASRDAAADVSSSRACGSTDRRNLCGSTARCRARGCRR